MLRDVRNLRRNKRSFENMKQEPLKESLAQLINHIESYGITEITINEFDENEGGKADLEFKSKNGLKIGVVVYPERFREDQLMEVKLRMLEKYDKFIFLTNFENYRRIGEIVGMNYCVGGDKRFDMFIGSDAELHQNIRHDNCQNIMIQDNTFNKY